MSLVRTIGRQGEPPRPGGARQAGAHPATDPTQVPDLKPLSSSNIAAAGYNSSTRVMRIEFRNGSIYDYNDVSPETWDAFLRAPSHGTFHHRAIRGSYGYAQVRGATTHRRR
jgi:hypothetical protein